MKGSGARSSPGGRDAPSTALPLNAGSDGAGPTEGIGAADAEVAWKRSQTSTAGAATAIRIPASRRSGRSPPFDRGRLRLAGRRRRRAARVAASSAGLGDEDVARPGRQEVGNVEASGPALHARDPLLEQDALDQLGLGEVAGAGDADLPAAGVLRLDLSRPLVRLGDRLLFAPTDVDERHLAFGAESLVQRVLAGAPRAAQATAARTSSGDIELDLFTFPSRIRSPRTVGALGIGQRADQVDRVGPVVGQVDVRLRRIGGVFVWE